MSVGDTLTLSLPYGDVVLDDSGRPVVFASAGIGIAPMAGMLSHLVAAGSGLDITLLHADADDVLRNPHAVLAALCAAVGIPFSERMLHWPAGPRPTDGAWAPAWYGSVQRSTGFSAPRDPPALADDLKALADSLRPHYEHLAQYNLMRRQPAG